MFSLFCKYVVLRFLELLTVKGDQNSFIKERQSKKYLISGLCLSHKKMKLKKKVKVDKNCFFNFQIFDTCVFNLCFQFSFFSFFFKTENRSEHLKRLISQARASVSS